MTTDLATGGFLYRAVMDALRARIAEGLTCPENADGRTVNLLIPLYLVVAAGTVTFLVPRWLGPLRGAGRPKVSDPDGSGGDDPMRRQPQRNQRFRGATSSTWLSPRGLEWLLCRGRRAVCAAGGVLADHTKAAENVAFFYIPFGLLFMLLRDVRWTRELVLRCLGVAVALAVVFAGIGFVEYARK